MIEWAMSCPWNIMWGKKCEILMCDCPASVQKSRVEFPCCCYIGHDSPHNLPEEVLEIEQVHISKVCPQASPTTQTSEFWLDSLLHVAQWAKMEEMCNK